MSRNRNFLACAVFGLVFSLTESHHHPSHNHETTCELPEPIPFFDQQWLSSPSEGNANNIYYHHAGSFAGLRRYAEILLPNYKQDQLENICLHESWKPNFDTSVVQWIQTGFGLQAAVHRHCDSVDGKSIVNTCYLTPTLTLFGDQNGSSHNITKEHVTLTDNNSFVVYVQCWEDGLKDWHAVVPLHKKLSDDSKAAILKHAQELGFDVESDIYYAKYDNCRFDE